MHVPLIVEYGKLFVLPLFASLPNKEQHKVFTDTPNGYRKIILATNIAETSITIPGVKYVIDTGMVKAKGLSHIILTDNQVLIYTQLVGNKAEGQISKRVFQESKARQILRKTNISYPPIRIRTFNSDSIGPGKGMSVKTTLISF